jgi:hypothetical protein
MGHVVYAKSSIIVHDEDCCKAETDGGCRILAAEADMVIGVSVSVD